MPPDSVHQGVNDRPISFTPFTVDEGVNVTIANPLKRKASPRERLGRRFPIRSPSPLFPFLRREKGDRWVSETVLNLHCQSVRIASSGVHASIQSAEDGIAKLKLCQGRAIPQGPSLKALHPPGRVKRLRPFAEITGPTPIQTTRARPENLLRPIFGPSVPFCLETEEKQANPRSSPIKPRSTPINARSLPVNAKSTPMRRR